MNTAAAPTQEYIVNTKCGRHFQWTATSFESLFRELYERGYEASFAMEKGMYDKLMELPDQEEIIAKLRQILIEMNGGLKHSA